MTSYNNARIVKNTLMLYFRMFLIMGIGLYTGRIILDTLGITDYGIYNVVGGVITMVSFLHAAIIASTQRFISFELGMGDCQRLRLVFCSSVNIHIAIAVVILLIGESVGLWFINTHLNIPLDRMTAANWVYQASIFVLIFKVLSVPYNAAIIAHEKMSAFAYISIVEALLDLGAVFSLYIVIYDKLIVYSILMVTVASLVRMCYIIYCRRYFEECKYAFIYDKKTIIEMFSFAGWSILGNMGTSFKSQILNIILNLFYGTTANAASGVGHLVSSKVNAFSTNFTMALNPQITKHYAAGNYQGSKELVYMGSRFSFFLLTIISMPFLLNPYYILNLWLTKVPEYAATFLQLSLLSALIYALSVCVTKAIQATGRVKWFQIGVFVITMGEVPAAWFLLRNGLPPYAVMIPVLFSNTIALFFRFWLIQRYIPIYRFGDYLIGVVARSVLTFIISYGLCYGICRLFIASFTNILISSVLCILITMIMIYAIGINQKERVLIQNQISKRLFKR